MADHVSMALEASNPETAALSQMPFGLEWIADVFYACSERMRHQSGSCCCKGLAK